MSEGIFRSDNNERISIIDPLMRINKMKSTKFNIYIYIYTQDKYMSQVKMSLIKSSKGNDQLLLDGFRYRRDKAVWRCVKDKCKDRARSE